MVLSVRVKVAVAALLAIAVAALFAQYRALHAQREVLNQQLAAGDYTRALDATAQQRAAVSAAAAAVVGGPGAAEGVTGNEFSSELVAAGKRHEVSVVLISVTPPNRSQNAAVPAKITLTASVAGSYVKVKALLAQMSAQFPLLALEQVALARQPAADGVAQAGSVKAEVRWVLYAGGVGSSLAAAGAKP